MSGVDKANAAQVWLMEHRHQLAPPMDEVAAARTWLTGHYHQFPLDAYLKLVRLVQEAAVLGNEEDEGAYDDECDEGAYGGYVSTEGLG